VTSNRAAVARRFAAASLERDDPNSWFEQLYAAAHRGEAAIPWAEFAPNPHLVSWAAARNLRGAGRRALVVGCGLGDDAEFLAGLGFEVTAFDVAPTAVAGATSRFPGSPVTYVVADVLAPPEDWQARYDLVFEAYTVQVHQGERRTRVVRHTAATVAAAGTLLVIAHARPIDDGPGPPWPLTRADIQSFAAGDLRLVHVDEVFDDNPPGHRWWAEYRRADRD
jgi:SAM-dependent methyltransferase